MHEASRPSIFSRPESRPAAMLVLQGRTIKLTPWKLRLSVAALTLSILAGVGSTGLFLASDNVAAAFREREARTVTAYERRIADLRRELDQVASRGLIDQETLAGRVRQIMVRQARIEDRYAALAPMMAELGTDTIAIGGIPTPDSRPNDMPMNANAYAPNDAPAPDPFAGFELRSEHALEDADDALLKRTQARLSQLEEMQIGQIDSMAQAASERSRQVLDLVEGVGVSLELSGAGGPFVPAADEEWSDPSISRLSNALEQLASARNAVDTLPFGRPVETGVRSSNFGTRLDPFLKRRARHTGVDYAAVKGTPVQSSGAGTVRFAGVQGGYGNLVIVDHANGLSSRYAHLSSIAVSKGDELAKGDVLGRVGSTGRSTGPHLHYEVRRQNVAVDPSPFLNIGRELRPLL